MNEESVRTNAQKIALFRQCFTGLTNVYGTYDPATGQARQVKAQVTDQVIYNHLKGIQPYGVYFLVEDRTRAIVVDFDDNDANPVMEYVVAARRYKIPVATEISKQKGYHCHTLFCEPVLAAKARLVVRHILKEINQLHVEIFPKQDRLSTNAAYGNFINAPLFWPLVRQGRTVFINEFLQPYANQWDYLQAIQRVPESLLDEIIDVNDLRDEPEQPPDSSLTTPTTNAAPSPGGLLPFARRILADGVQAQQRVACFRLAIHMKKVGLPYEVAAAALKAWAIKNRPDNGNRILTEYEIMSQTASVYRKDYTGYGCQESAIKPFCDPECPIIKNRAKESNG